MIQEPGILISLSNQIMTPQMRDDLKRMSMTALQIVQSLQLIRYIVKDVGDVLEGDLVSMIALLTNVLLLVARIKMATDAMLIKQGVLIAQQSVLQASILRMGMTL